MIAMKDRYGDPLYLTWVPIAVFFAVVMLFAVVAPALIGFRGVQFGAPLGLGVAGLVSYRVHALLKQRLNNRQ